MLLCSNLTTASIVYNERIFYARESTNIDITQLPHCRLTGGSSTGVIYLAQPLTMVSHILNPLEDFVEITVLI